MIVYYFIFILPDPTPNWALEKPVSLSQLDNVSSIVQ
jgi:hypothetical protein